MHYHGERNHQASTTLCSSLPLLRLGPFAEVVFAGENVSDAYSDTTVALHEYFDQTANDRIWFGIIGPKESQKIYAIPIKGIARVRNPARFRLKRRLPVITTCS